MKKLFLVMILLSIFASACGSAGSTATSTALAASTPTRTQTSLPTATLTATIAPTATRTSLPPLPTFVPTFDISTIITATSAKEAICPSVEPAKKPIFDFVLNSFSAGSRETEKNALDFLNSNGAKSLLKYLRSTRNAEWESFAYIDITNDGIPELVVGMTDFYVFGCSNGKYVTMLYFERNALIPPSIVTITDNTRNGIPELTMRTQTLSQGGHTYEIYEWDGNKFRTLHTDEIWAEVDGKISFTDIDHDQINELILDSGVPVWETYYSGLPWRNKRTVYEWDGLYYVPARHEFAPPEFRFQAVQDGDLASEQLEFEKALNLYEEAISNKYLNDFSPEIRKNLQANWQAQWNPLTPTPTPYPSDIAEYHQLAAYAYYRIMLLHIVEGNEAEAENVLKTLQEKFPPNNPGYPYVEMAGDFMVEYLASHNITNACGAAIQFATEYPKILVPLGSDYHGEQSHRYTPYDVCPFR